MNWYITIILLVTFFSMEFVYVKEFDSILKNKVILSGIYTLIGWSIYFFGIYEITISFYYAIPAIIGASFGKMLAVYLKKKANKPD